MRYVVNIITDFNEKKYHMISSVKDISPSSKPGIGDGVYVERIFDSSEFGGRMHTGVARFYGKVIFKTLKEAQWNLIDRIFEDS